MKVLPYVYKVVNRTTGEFYIGYREANKKPAAEDILIYKTSSKKVRPIFDQFDSYIIAEFFDGVSAYWVEQLFIEENINDPLCLNGYYIKQGKKQFKSKFGRVFSKDAKQNISNGRNRIDKTTGLTNAQMTSIRSVKTRIENNSYKTSTEKANKTKEQRGSNVIGGEKASITKNAIDEQTGLTNAQLAGKKASITKNAIDEQTGLTNAQLAGKKASITKTAIDEQTGLTNAQLAGLKLRQTLKSIDPNTGLTLKELQIKKATETKRNNPRLGSNSSNAKHIKIFDNNQNQIYECIGTFYSLCEQLSLPTHLFRKSYKQNGTPITSKNSKYFGWYALLLPKA